jgi:hypothetical protein
MNEVRVILDTGDSIDCACDDVGASLIPLALFLSQFEVVETF